MKKITSIILVLVMLLSVFAIVPFSTQAESSAPSYRQFQAQKYSIDKMIDFFEIESYNHAYVGILESDESFMNSVTGWEFTNNILDPTSWVDNGYLDKVEYYQLMLFDVVNSAVKYNDTLDTLNNKYLNYIIDATKAITKDCADSDISKVLTQDISVDTANKISTIMSTSNDVANSADKAMKVIKYADTTVDYIEKMARYNVTNELVEYEIRVFETIRESTDDFYLKTAVDRFIAYQEGAASQVLIDTLELSEFSIGLAYDVVVTTLWTAIIGPIGASLNLVYQGTKAITNAWFATDYIIEAYYAMAALDDFEMELKKCLINTRDNYMAIPSDENAEMFMASVELYQKTVMVGCDYIEKLLDAMYKKAAWSLAFGSEQEMLDSYNALYGYKNTMINSFNQLEGTINSLYQRQNNPNYSELLGLADKTMNVVPIQGVAVKNKELSLAVNEESYAIAVLSPSDTTESQLLYSSDNEEVVSIGAMGNMNALSEGTAVITIKSAVDESLCDTMTVTVSGVYDSVTGNITHIDSDGNETVIIDAHYKDFIYSVSNGATTITKYTGTASNVYVPSTLGGCPVTSIGNCAFENCKNLTSVSLPQSLKSMGYYVFRGCKNLKTITIPKNVTTSGNIGALGESYIETVIFEDGMGKVPSYFCANATYLKNVEIPNSVTSIGNRAFENCSSLADFEIPIGVTSIGSHAFENCSSLVDFEIPNGVTTIYESTFAGCGFETVEIHEGITSIENCAFENCKNLTSVSLPQSLKSMGYYVFRGCKNLKTITIPKNVTTSGNIGALGESYIETVIFEDGMEKVPSYFCANATYLKNVEIPNSVTSIGNRAFENCRDITIYGCNDSYAEKYAIANGIFFVALDSTADYYVGDADGDSEITILDVTAVQYYLVSFLQDSDGRIVECCDVNGDGVVSIMDATEIQFYLAGLSNNANIGNRI